VCVRDEASLVSFIDQMRFDDELTGIARKHFMTFMFDENAIPF